jgi:CRISPR-associated protein Cmr3
MSTYKLIEIELTPITPYFFGKEPFHQLGNKSDYFQTSLDFPQQTTLLGFLRHKVLRDNGIDLNKLNPKNIKNLDLNTLIGKQSFEVNNNQINCFSKIHSISPCYVVDDSIQKLFFENCENIDGQLLALDKFKRAFTTGNEPYINKKFFDNTIGSIKKDNCIHDSAKVGIYKGGVKTVSTSKSYFIMEYKHLGIKESIDKKKIFSRFKKWSFGFQALVEQDLIINKKNDIMPMGKEQSLFKVTTKIINENIATDKPLYDYKLITDDSLNSDVIKCVLLSDTKVSQDKLTKIKSLCLLQVTNKQRLRYIKRKSQDYFLGEKPIKETKAFNLIAKGSVFFIDKSNKDSVASILNEAQDFKQIGYNYFYFKNTK